nr:MAG TPA: hypothetical protein [Caudoviricetes sp.]
MYRWLVGNRLASLFKTRSVLSTPLECYTNASSLPLWDGESEHDEQGIFLRHIHFCLCF